MSKNIDFFINTKKPKKLFSIYLQNCVRLFVSKLQSKHLNVQLFDFFKFSFKFKLEVIPESPYSELFEEGGRLSYKAAIRS